MGKIGIILYWFTNFFLKKRNLPMKSQIKETNVKLVSSFKYFSIKSMTRNNLDIKPKILKLFFISFLINSLFAALIILGNTMYTSIYFYNLLNCKIPGVIMTWNWVVTFILNILSIILIVRFISDSFKLSLRGKYRINYLKVLTLDILTLNILSIIGSLVFNKNKIQVIKTSDDFLLDIKNLNSKEIKDYFNIIFILEIFTLFLILFFMLLFLLLGYFVKNNAIKLISCALIVMLTMLFYGWSIPRIIGAIILKKMYENLLINDSYYLFLSIIRFLAFGFGYYHIAVLINILKFKENSKIFILENW